MGALVNMYIKLRISGIGLNLQEITDQLGFMPASAGKKGDIIPSKWQTDVATILPEDVWLGEHKFDNATNPEHEIEQFAIRLRPSAPYLKSLSKKHSITFWITAYPEGEQANVHVSALTIDILSEIGATLDCSMLFLKDFYEGKY